MRYMKACLILMGVLLSYPLQAMPPAPAGPYKSLEDALSSSAQRPSVSMPRTVVPHGNTSKQGDQPGPVFSRRDWNGGKPAPTQSDAMRKPQWDWGAPSIQQPLLYREPGYSNGHQFQPVYPDSPGRRPTSRHTQY